MAPAFDDAVAQLVALGYGRAIAEAEVRRQYPELAPPPEPPKVHARLERDEQVEVRKLAIAFGFKVDNLSQYRPSRVAVGFPDLFLRHRTQPIALFWEVKKHDGKRTTSQEEFGDDVVRCNVGYGWGDRYAFVEKLIELELAVRGAGAYGIEPIRLATSSPG